MDPLLARTLNDLSQSQVVVTLEKIFELAYDQTDVAAVYASAEQHAPSLVSVDPLTLQCSLSAEDSIRLGRLVLTLLANDPQLERLLRYVLDHSVLASDRMGFGRTVLALGLVVNVTLLVATTKVEFKTEAGTIVKEAVSAEQLRTVVEPVTELIKHLPNR